MKLLQKITAPKPQKRAQFGIDIAMAGDVLVIGEHGRNGPVGPDQGAAYIYERDATGAYRHVTTLMADDADPTSLAGDQFGYRVAISPDAQTIGVGSFSKKVGNLDVAGQVYIYERAGGWKLSHKIRADEPEFRDAYSKALEISDDLVAASITGDEKKGLAPEVGGHVEVNSLDAAPNEDEVKILANQLFFLAMHVMRWKLTSLSPWAAGARDRHHEAARTLSRQIARKILGT